MHSLIFSNPKYSRGFTLIELLVVIAIIGLLSSVVLTSLNNARISARDAVRKSDIQQIKNALELYRAANPTGLYPTTPDFAAAPPAPNGAWRNSNHPSWDTLAAQLSPYIILPHDPKEDTYVDANSWPGGNKFSYAYYSNAGSLTYGCTGGQYYVLVYRLEKAGAPMGGVKDCDSDPGTNFQWAGAVTTGMPQN